MLNPRKQRGSKITFNLCLAESAPRCSFARNVAYWVVPRKTPLEMFTLSWRGHIVSFSFPFNPWTRLASRGLFIAMCYGSIALFWKFITACFNFVLCFVHVGASQCSLDLTAGIFIFPYLITLDLIFLKQALGELLPGSSHCPNLAVMLSPDIRSHGIRRM